LALKKIIFERRSPTDEPLTMPGIKNKEGKKVAYQF
jgi:hypothetical protein